jgi:hypothetical protein
VFGETAVTIGAEGADMLKFAEDCPPPGVGFDTTSWTVPGAASCVAETEVVNSEALMKVTFCCAPFQVSVEVARKFDPLIVKVKLAVPAAALDGETDWIAGTGFEGGGGGELGPPPQEDNTKAKPQKNPGSVRDAALNLRDIAAHLSRNLRFDSKTAIVYAALSVSHSVEALSHAFGRAGVSTSVGNGRACTQGRTSEPLRVPDAGVRSRQNHFASG